MGLVTHESPRLTYTRQDMDKPLEAGMILSIETTLHHPQAASSSWKAPSR